MIGLWTGNDGGISERQGRSRWRRRGLGEPFGFAGVCSVLAVVWLLVVACGSSSAATGHPFRSRLTEAPGGSPLVEPAAAVVDHATGDVFVADPGTGMVDVYSSAGVFLTQFGEGKLLGAGVAVDEASGLVYVADSFEDAVLVFKPNGSGGYGLLSEWFGEGLPGEEFGEVAGVAVDNSKSASAGDVYVVDSEDALSEAGVVDVFKPKPAGPDEAQEGELVRQLSGGGMELPNGVAVSPVSGQVVVADSAKGLVYLFGASGAPEGKFTGSGSPLGAFGKEEAEGNVSGVAVDEASGDILVAEAERHVVSEFNAAGEWVGWITSTPSGVLGEPRGVAVASSGDVYVADAGQKVVDVFGPGVVVPNVVTSKASKATRTTAILNGSINGDGKPAKYSFQWGTSEALGQTTIPVAAGSGEEKVSATLAELHAGTTYFFRIVGENENGANYGAVREFATSPAVEGVSTGAVTNLKPASVTLNGALKPGGIEAHYYFEWGATTAYGNKSPEPPIDAGSGTEAVKAETALAGLAPNTVYHYRIVAENGFGTTVGADGKFTTSGPPRITTEAATAIGHEEATIHAKINPGELPTTYHFEYGETTSYGTEVPSGGASIPAGEAPVAVSATLTKLKLGVTYHYRVLAENEAGPPTVGPDQTFTTVPPALIDSESVVEVSATTAKLQTQVNPLGHDTTFYFQYGPQPCKPNPAGCTSVPTPPGSDIGAGETDVPASQPLQELQPATTYHYRVIAINTLGTSEGTEHTFTTQATSTPFALPDDRAWEMVSPPNKQGAPVEALPREGGLILAAEDGNTFTYVVNGALGGEEVQGNRSPEWQQVVADRGANEWQSHDVANASSKSKGVTPGQTPEYQYFTPDLSTALVEPPVGSGSLAEPPLAPGVVQATVYLRDNATGTYLPLVTEANTAPGTTFGGKIHFVSATPDLSRVVISSGTALTGPSSASGLYEWSGGTLQLVSVLPEGVPAKGLIELGDTNDPANALSIDGSRVIWTTLEGERLGHLYMRDTDTGETVKLDAAQGVAEPTGTGSARFQTASSDGSRVFFTDGKRLTPDSTAEALPSRPDLYECEMVVQGGKLACSLTDLTADQNPGEHANVQGLLFGTSQDGTSTYFVAQGVLAANENGNHEKALNGKNNLYEAHFDGSQWMSTFIAVISSEDNPEWEGFHVSNTAFLTARVSPDGRYLAFMSAASLTGYDNVDASTEAKGAHDEEVYQYDSATASLRCVSCSPTDARPRGVLDAEGVGEGLGRLVDRRKVWFGHWLAGNIPGWTAENITSALLQSRYLSDDGRLYFNSPDSLLPQAGNGKENVYEYEPSGLGSCESATGGCISLLSSGSSGKESAFIEATPDGSNVFFVTAAQLLPQDTDTAFDIYDARECSQASPCQTPAAPAEPGCSTADACRAASPPVQAPVAPGGSGTFTGPGNIVVPPPPAKQEQKGAKSTAKTPTRAQKLAKALKTCRKQHNKKKRTACEKHARKLYGAKTAQKHAKSKAKRSTAPGRSSARSGR